MAVGAAIEAGYRMIDTAARYGNERGVGRAVAAAAVPREELFVVTKLRGSQQGYEEALAAFEESRERLGLEYVDLYLIHWPLPGLDRYVASWRAFVELRERGLARSIGVSNFTPAHIERIERETGVLPAVNQIEMHPDFAQAPLRAWHAARGHRRRSRWSPLGAGSALLADPAIGAIAARARPHARPGGAALARPGRRGADPQVVRPARGCAENLDVFGFALDDAEMAAAGRPRPGPPAGRRPRRLRGDVAARAPRLPPAHPPRSRRC